MRPLTLTLTLTLYISLSLPCLLHAQQPLSQDQLMTKAAAANVVGTEHDLIKAMAGKWKEETYYNFDPSQPPMKVTGTATTRLILGDRFAQLEAVSMFMGEKSERMTIFGHDNRKGLYTWDGYDTFGTYAVHAEGTYDEGTKTLTMAGTEADPLMPHPIEFRVILRFPNPDQIDYEIWFLTDMDGNPVENKIVWATTKRVK